ncbi:nucleoside-diphosphate kinase [Candidatus Woesearchaeota archaeon CG10_big_fil_rev_8_21_14_0_10_44_13]|nr:MAG: nucleoside-diphosphate kinase [Candidatus Woesearchaeota archaeon CG10_big_fil_rev_8_21_14_0_10_44_13]
MKERTLVILKPDAVNRTIVGEIIHRFEAKGLKITGMKMTHLDEDILGEHYSHHKGKPFYKGLVKFMMHCPSLLVVLEGNHAVDVVRKLAGETHGAKAAPGTIRGDYSLSNQCNALHASDSIESAKIEIKRFFRDNELFDYSRIDTEMIYAEDER